MLRVHWVDDEVRHSSYTVSEPLTKRRLALELTLAWVYPPLRNRITKALYLRPWDLVLWVRRHLVRPFRLLDLPPELRTQIFSYALGLDAETVLAPLQGNVNVNHYPLMTPVSRQLRKETIPLCYA